MKHILIILAMVFAYIPTASARTLEDAREAVMVGNDTLALEILTDLADRENAIAQERLCWAHQYGKFGLPVSYDSAALWCGKASANGNESAEFRLGSMYSRGLKDFEKAAYWYGLPAHRDNTHAQLSLADVYANPDNPNRDYRAAIYWRERSASLGDGGAYVDLAAMYIYSYGVLQDFEKARYLLQQAGAIGDSSTLYDLGQIYRIGPPAFQDYVLAHMWYNVNIASSADAEVSYADLSKMYLDDLTQRMTRSQVALAQRLARECLANDMQDCGY